jgi:hypothetical protein
MSLTDHLGTRQLLDSAHPTDASLEMLMIAFDALLLHRPAAMFCFWHGCLDRR